MLATPNPTTIPAFFETLPEGYKRAVPRSERPPIGAYQYLDIDITSLRKEANGDISFLWRVREINRIEHPNPSGLFHVLDYRNLYNPDGTPRELTTDDAGITRNEDGAIVSPNYAAFLRLNSNPANGLDTDTKIAMTGAFSAVSSLIIEAKAWQESSNTPVDTVRLAVAMQTLFTVMPEALGETTKAALITEMNALLAYFNMGFEVA